MLAIARRHAINPDDAEDAYQRGLEILLTKAPTTREDELVGWLKTVVKHEAWALARQRDRATPVADDRVIERAAGAGDAAGERAERLERLRQGAEALGRLKPQEVRALLLRAEGYSYRQIQEITGWTYTKVNRCVTEGRASFLRRIGDIEGGAECERLASHLSALADGEAGAEEMAALRPHLRSCLVCRARLREYRAAPGQVAALLPLPLVAAGDAPCRVARLAEWLHAAVSERVAAVSVKAHQAVELASAQKVAAVAASTAVIAGGGVATVRSVERPERPQRAAERAERPAHRVVAVSPAPPIVPARPSHPPTPPARRPSKPRERPRARSAPDASAASEFDPTGLPAPSAGGGVPAPAPSSAQPASAPPPDPAAAEFTP